MPIRASRRSFLKAMAASAVAGPLVSRLVAVEEAFGAELGATRALRTPRIESEAMEALYLLDPDIVYLNHASIGTIPRAVHDARAHYLELCESNPWLYMWGGAWEEAREGVRADAAALLGCQSTELAITHNTTEGFNLLAHGLPVGAGDEVLFSSLNHDGASVCWNHLAPVRGFEVRRFRFPVEDVSGMTEEDVLQVYSSQIGSATRVLVLPHIDNAVGIRIPLDRLSRMARDRGVEFILVDGAQTAGMIPLDLDASGVDAYSTSPHKWLQAPKGLGLLYVRSSTLERLRPMWVTWGQNRWRGTARVLEDYGTRNLPELLALGDAVSFQNTLGDTEKQRRLQEIWQRMYDRVDASPTLTWNSPRGWDSGGSLVNVGIAGVDAPDVSNRLYADHGVVLRPFRTEGLNGVRLSPNVSTTNEKIDQFFDWAEALA